MNWLAKICASLLVLAMATSAIGAWPAPLDERGVTRTGVCRTANCGPSTSTIGYHNDVIGVDTAIVHAQAALTQIQILQKQVNNLKQTPAEKVDYTKIWNWLRDHKAEFKGSDGQDGKSVTGPPGQVDYEKIWKWIRHNKDELLPPVPEPTNTDNLSVLSAVYVTSTKYCNGCAPVTKKVEDARGTGLKIAIVELDGSITGLTEQQKLTVTLGGLPAIHDFATSRSYVGVAECERFLATIKTPESISTDASPK